MGKHLKNKNSSQSRDKYNHKPGWLAGMFNVLDFHHWRAKNRPICWKTPRTHSLIRATDEQEPFLDGDSKNISVVADDDKQKRQERDLKKMVSTKHVTEYVDFLEILRKEDVFVKILKDPDSKFGKQLQIKSNPRILPKSGSFPLSGGSTRPSRIEHKQKENWYAPKQNGAVMTLNVSRDTSLQEHKHNNVHPHRSVINGFREIKKLLKNALQDRKHTKKKKSKVSNLSEDDYVGRYSQLLEQSFSRRKGDELRSRSLKVSYEEKRENKPQFFRRISSLSSLEVLGSFLTDLPQDSTSTRNSVDQDSSVGSKKSLLISESLVRTEKEEEQEQRNQENHLDSSNHRSLQQEPDSVSEIDSQDNTAKRTQTSLSQGLGQSSLEIYNNEEEYENTYFCFVKKVLEVSGFLENKDNEEKWYSEEQPLNPSLLYELNIQEEEEEVNKEILFELVNEAIAENHNQSQTYFPKTLISFASPNGKRFLDEVWRRVEWSLSGLGAEYRDRSLDDIVGRDLTKLDGWMNLRGESEWLTLELEDLILDEVLDELLCVYS